MIMYIQLQEGATGPWGEARAPWTMSGMADFSSMARTIATECPMLPVRQASRVLSSIFDELIRPLGLQASQLAVLVGVALAGESGSPLGPLAQAMVLDSTTLTRNIRPLVKRGLVRVSRSPHDARVRVVLLTRGGERMIEAIFPRWQKALANARAKLGDETLGELRKQAQRVVAETGGFVAGRPAGRRRPSAAPARRA